MENELVNKEYRDGLIEKASVNEEKREVTVVITEESLDLDGDVVITKGVNFKDFLKNGAIIFGHNTELVLAKPLTIKRVGNKIHLKMRFPEKGLIKRERANPDDTWELIKMGAIQSLSIGFLNMEPPRMPSKLDIQNFGKGLRRVLHKTMLIETSFVAVPSNRGTEILAMKSLDIDPKFYFGDDYIEEIIEEKEVDNIEDAIEDNFDKFEKEINDVEGLPEDDFAEKKEEVIEEIKEVSEEDILFAKIKKELGIQLANKEVEIQIKEELSKWISKESGRLYW